jgi:hypothetical protein
MLVPVRTYVGLLTEAPSGVEMTATQMPRRAFLAGGLALLLAAPPAGAGRAAVTVYKEPT